MAHILLCHRDSGKALPFIHRMHELFRHETTWCVTPQDGLTEIRYANFGAPDVALVQYDFREVPGESGGSARVLQAILETYPHLWTGVICEMPVHHFLQVDFICGLHTNQDWLNEQILHGPASETEQIDRQTGRAYLVPPEWRSYTRQGGPERVY